MIRRCVATVFVAGLGLSVANAQTASEPVTSAADLARALIAAGVELPEGVQILEDGSVSLPGSIPAVEGEAAAADASAAATDAAAVDASAAVPAGESPIPVKPKPEWDNKIDISLNLSDGNAETTSFRAGYVGTRKTKRSALSLDASYNFATNDGTTDQNQATAGINHDWLMPDSRWFYFAGARADYNQFASWRYRTNANGGVGYNLIKRENLTLDLRAGAGVFREFGSDRDEIVAEALFGADLNWSIADNQSLEASFRYFPEFGEFADFRTVSSATWRLDLDNINDGLALVAGIRHEYLSVVDAGTEQSDVNVFAGVTWDF